MVLLTHAVDVPLGPDVVECLLPAVAAALDEGPALLPLPARPRAVRDMLRAELRPEETVDDGIAFVVPTSGSTGSPKGVVLSASAIRASVAATHDRLGGPGRWLLATPATHIAGLMVLARSAVAGTEPVAVDLAAGFDPGLFAAASARLFDSPGDPRRRYTSLVPKQLSAVIGAAGAALDALTSYDAVLVGGGGLAEELRARAEAAGVTVVTTYGMTETCGGCVYDGRPLTGVSVRIVDGRILLAGPMLASGYRRRTEQTDATEQFRDGWFATTDAGYVDADGRLVVTGRVDDVAISGGVNVPLTAVDLAVSSHPDVRDALSVAVPDDEWGQRVVTAVVPHDPSRPPTLASVRAYVSDRAPVAYAPKELVVIDAVPTVPGGKADRRALARHLGLDAPATN